MQKITHSHENMAEPQEQCLLKILRNKFICITISIKHKTTTIYVAIIHTYKKIKTQDWLGDERGMRMRYGDELNF